MEKFELILKRELGVFEKILIDFRENMQKEMSDFKEEMTEFRTDMQKEMSDFKEEMKDEMSNFKNGMTGEMSNFKNGMTNQMSDFKLEIKNEIGSLKSEMRNRFFVFEHEYGRKIDAMYDIIVLNKELTDLEIQELKKKEDINEMRIIKNSLEIDSIKKSKKFKTQA